MGQIQGVLQAQLQSGRDMIVPGSIIAKDIADGNITIDKLAVSKYYYTLTVQLPHPLNSIDTCIDISTGRGLGYQAFGLSGNIDDMANVVVPYDSDLSRIDLSVSNPWDLLVTDEVKINFSTASRHDSGTDILSQGISVRGGSSAANQYFQWNEGSMPHYSTNTIFWVHLDTCPSQVKNITVSFTLRRSIN